VATDANGETTAATREVNLVESSATFSPTPTPEN